MFLLSSNPIVENNVFSHNTALNGGAVYILKSDFNNNVVVDNSDTQRGGGLYFGAPGPVSADNNISADPIFCSIVDEDYQLLELSPCTA